MELPEETHLCFMFELITPRYPIVVVPSEERIVLHGVRNMENLYEIDTEEFRGKVSRIFLLILSMDGRLHRNMNLVIWNKY